MIPVNKFSSRLGERVRLVVLHTSEGARTVESLGAFLNKPGVNASYHGAVDDVHYAAYVDYSVAAWHLRDGNQESDGLCLCGWANWTIGEWLRHGRMLDLAAAWLVERTRARGVPLRRLTDAECAAALRDDRHVGGVVDHWTYTRATQDGTHTDLGGTFPWTELMARARQIQEATVAPTAAEIAQQVWELHRTQNAWGSAQPPSNILRYAEKWGKDAAIAAAAVATKVDAQGAQLARIEAQLAALLAAHPKG